MTLESQDKKTLSNVRMVKAYDSIKITAAIIEHIEKARMKLMP